MSDLPTRERMQPLAIRLAHDTSKSRLVPEIVNVVVAYADGELQTRAEWEATIDYRCDKCGSVNVNIDYEYTDRLRCRCQRCRFEWTEKPIDAAVKETDHAT